MGDEDDVFRRARDASSILPRAEIERLIDQAKQDALKDMRHDLNEARNEIRGWITVAVEEFLAEQDIHRTVVRFFGKLGLRIGPDPDVSTDDDIETRKLVSHLRRQAGREGTIGRVLGYGVAVVTIGGVVASAVGYAISHVAFK